MSVAVTVKRLVPTDPVLKSCPGRTVPMQLTMALADPFSVQRKRAAFRARRW
jgi:hypothetical protein